MRLLIVIPEAADANSYYRSVGPFTSLLKELHNFSFEVHNGISWSLIGRFDAVYMQRACGADAVEAARLVIKMGKPLWCDWDDNMFAVRKSNPLYTPDQKELQATVAEMASIASVVTVSTPYLRTVFEKYNENTHVIENAVDTQWYRNFVAPEPGPAPIVYWRGSPSHLESLHYYAETIEQVAKEHPEALFVFHGIDPYCIKIPEAQYRHIAPQRLPDCFITQMELQPLVQFIAIQESEFDMARSPIAWMEGTMAGALVVANSWYLPGSNTGLTFATKEEMHTALNTAIGMDRDSAIRKQYIDNSLCLINTKYNLLSRNEKRICILNQFSETRPSKIFLSNYAL